MLNFFDLSTKKSILYKGRTFNVFDFVSSRSNYNTFSEMCEYFKDIIEDNTIVFVDDEKLESFGYHCVDDFIRLLKKIDEEKKNLLYVFVTETLFNLSKSYEIKNSIHEPHLEILNSYYILIKYRKYLVDNCNDNYPYVSLNGLVNPLRIELLEVLEKYHLLEHGYVTAFSKSFVKINDKIRNKLKYDKVFESYYYNQKYSSTKNLINLLYINKHIPGNIFLTVESFNSTDVDKSLRPLYTEKTLTPFLLKRIPLILGFKNIMKTIKSEGFDIFEDYINYDYDAVDPKEFKNKVNLCVEKNINVLNGQNKIKKDDINLRLEYNKNHIFNWLKTKVNNTELLISNKLDTFI